MFRGFALKPYNRRRTIVPYQALLLVRDPAMPATPFVKPPYFGARIVALLAALAVTTVFASLVCFVGPGTVIENDVRMVQARSFFYGGHTTSKSYRYLCSIKLTNLLLQYPHSYSTLGSIVNRSAVRTPQCARVVHIGRWILRHLDGAEGTVFCQNEQSITDSVSLPYPFCRH